jgi:hypothetical protein
MAHRLFSLFALALFIAIEVQAGSGNVLRPGFAVPQQYIVLLDAKQNLRPASVAAELARAHGGRVGVIWNDVVDGFTITIPDAAAAAIARDPRVKVVEQNGRMFASTAQQTTVPPIGAEPNASSLWALDRIDQRTYTDGTTDGRFLYCDDAFGVEIYVMDSGVLKTHQEFHRSATDTTTRVANGMSFTTVNGDGVTPADHFPAPGETVDYGTNPCGTITNPGGSPNAGHGTAVASVAAGRITGVAKGATIVPVKVIQCGGEAFISDAISGLNWIVQRHLNDPYVPKVVNMSMYYWLPGTAPYCPPAVTPSITTAELTSLEQAVQSVIANGVSVIVSANNQNQDARNLSPSRLAYGNTAIAGPHVVTVGGMMRSGGIDQRWVSSPYDPCGTAGSNWGVAVDLFAPSHDITSAAISNSFDSRVTYGYRTVADGRDGTSFAAPYVAGIVARYLQVNTGARTPLDVWQHLQNYSTYDSLAPSTLNGSPNRLLYRAGAETCRIRAVH